MRAKIAMVLAAAFMLSACDGAVDTSDFALAQPDAEYELDTWGFNSEVYEFTPRTAPHKTCVMLMLDNGRAVGLQCFDKA